MKDLRRVVVTAVIGSFSLAALMGILALLGAGDFGEGEGRVLLTTVVVGLESVAALCYLALAGHRLAVVGGVGAAVSLVAVATALPLVWGSEIDGEWRLLLASTVVAATFAQASLLIALVEGSRYGGALLATLAAAAVAAAMLVNAVLADHGLPDGYWRVFGVVAILDVLGSVVLIALGGFDRAVGRSVGAPRLPRTPGRPDIVLDREVQDRIVELAQQRQSTPGRLVNEALDEYLARH